MVYLKGHGGVVSGLMMGMTGVIVWLIGVTNLLSPHDPPSRVPVRARAQDSAFRIWALRCRLRHLGHSGTT